MFAVLFGRNEVVKLLLESGADVAIRDHRGLTAFDHATQQSNGEALALLGHAA
jgi:ankyrin repeat protein